MNYKTTQQSNPTQKPRLRTVEEEKARLNELIETWARDSAKLARRERIIAGIVARKQRINNE